LPELFIKRKSITLLLVEDNYAVWLETWVNLLSVNEIVTESDNSAMHCWKKQMLERLKLWESMGS